MNRQAADRKVAPLTRAATSADPLRSAADELGRHSTGRFRPRASLESTPAGERTVALAIARAKHGDQDALRYLYLRYSDNVYGYVRSIVRDEHEAEDVTQHVFAKLMTVLPQYEERGIPFAAWVLRIARNVALDFMRQRRAIPREEVPEHACEADDGLDDRSITLREALGTLPEGQREVVVLRHVLGLSPSEIADRLGTTEPSVHGLHHRGRGALRAALADSGVSPAVAA